MSESENATDVGKKTGEVKVDRREAMKTVVRNSAYAVPIATVMLTKSKGAVAGEDGGGGGGDQDSDGD